MLAATAAIVVVVAACVPIKPGPPAAPSIPFGSAHPQAQELYYLVNAERAANGLGPVGWHDQLGGLAQGWSEHMAGSGNFSHQNLDAILQSPGYSGFGSSFAACLKNRSWTCGPQLIARSTRIGRWAWTIWSEIRRRYSRGTGGRYHGTVHPEPESHCFQIGAAFPGTGTCCARPASDRRLPPGLRSRHGHAIEVEPQSPHSEVLSCSG